MGPLTLGLLKQAKRKTGKAGEYLFAVVEIDGEAVPMSLFDAWYFEKGTDHDITEYIDKPVQVLFSTTTRSSDSRVFKNIDHIQPDMIRWVKPEEGMGDRKPGPLTSQGSIPKLIERSAELHDQMAATLRQLAIAIQRPATDTQQEVSTKTTEEEPAEPAKPAEPAEPKVDSMGPVPF